MSFFKFKLKFANTFAKTSYKIFNEGFLIDFAQKKTVSIFLKKSVFLTFFIYNDKFIFEKIIFSIIDSSIWIKNKKALFLVKAPSVTFNILITLTCLILLVSLLF